MPHAATCSRLNIVALAVLKFSDAFLPSGKKIMIPPQDQSGDARKLAASIDKLLKAQGLNCDVGQMLNCAVPLSQRIIKQENDLKPVLEKTKSTAVAVQESPDFERCRQSGDARTKKFILIGAKIGDEYLKRLEMIAEYFNELTKETAQAILACQRPDITTCEIRLRDGAPNKPIAKDARRKLNNPMGGATPED